MRRLVISTLLLVSIGCASAPPVRLTRVVLYQNGVGYFERAGRVENGQIRLRLAAHEVDDVLTTLTVVDPDHPEDAASPSAVMPTERREAGGVQELALQVGARDRTLTVAYAAPTSAWRASYRIVLPESADSDDAWFQAWAVVDNTSAEDWRDVDLTLATDAPLSFAVDLRTPRMVDRPSVNGYHAPPVAFGVVLSERSTRGGGRDGDRIADEDDLCPDEPEDYDGFEDTDGCPDPDNDADGILDVDDECPTDSEAYNGLDDSDGCPDMGRVVIQESALRILEQIYFAADSSAIQPTSAPILDAVAATLNGNPELLRTEIRGHADSSEDSPFRLSAERAGAVRLALEQRGVSGARLVSIPMGDSQPIAGGPERNRRVAFDLAEREPPSLARGAVRRSSLEQGRSRSSLPEVMGSGTRFPVARSVSIPAGTSAMVAILERAIQGQDVLLYRVDPSVPASASHPFRAARLVNQSGVDLVAGPVSIFSTGELVGEGMLASLAAGENAFIPYAVDSSTHVSHRLESETRPARVLSIERGRVAVERTEIRRTLYDLEVGSRAPARIFVRHARAAGFEPHDLPPGSETNPAALLVALPLEPGTDVTLTVDERRTVEGAANLADPRSMDLRPYLAGSSLSPADEARLSALLDDRDALLRIAEEVAQLRAQLGDAGMRTAELRRTLLALDERAGRVVSPIRRRVAGQLDGAVEHAEELAGRLATRGAEELEARLRLREAAEQLTIAAPAR